MLAFTDEAEGAGLVSAREYEVQWLAFDNERGTTAPLGGIARTREKRLRLPAARPEYLMARLRPNREGTPPGKRVDVYVRTAGSGTVVGLERD